MNLKSFIILTITTLLLSTPLFAQTAKRVAILDVVNRDGAINYGVKTMVLGSLEYAVNDMPGYEAYDRTNLESIMNEHNFQRSGNVSEEERRKMGEMHGVSYILIPIVEKLDADHITIDAKIIDVETGQMIKKARPQWCQTNAEKIEEACIKVARTLFKKDETAQVKKDETTQNKTFTDLGLPSRTLWKNDNEQGYYTYDEAFSKFGNRLPSKEQWLELKNKCNWKWTGSGYKVTGPNGNSIFLPAAGYSDGTEVDFVGTGGGYWSSTYFDEYDAWYVRFHGNDLAVDSYYRSIGLSVRLVKEN